MRTLLQVSLILCLSIISVTICYAEVSNVKINADGLRVIQGGEVVNDLRMTIRLDKRSHLIDEKIVYEDYLVGEPIQIIYTIGTVPEISPDGIVVIEKGSYFDKVALSFSVKDSSGKEITKIEKDKSILSLDMNEILKEHFRPFKKIDHIFGVKSINEYLQTTLEPGTYSIQGEYLMGKGLEKYAPGGKAWVGKLLSNTVVIKIVDTK